MKGERKKEHSNAQPNKAMNSRLSNLSNAKYKHHNYKQNYPMKRNIIVIVFWLCLLFGVSSSFSPLKALFSNRTPRFSQKALHAVSWPLPLFSDERHSYASKDLSATYRTTSNALNALSARNKTTSNGLNALSARNRTTSNGLNALSARNRTTSNGLNALSARYRTTSNGLNALSARYRTTSNALNALSARYRTTSNGLNAVLLEKSGIPHVMADVC